MLKTFLRGILLLSFILFLSFLFILKKSWSPESLKALKSLNKLYVYVSFFFLFLVHTFDNLRLYIISRALGVRYSLLYGYVVSLINTFGATVTPAHVGGEGTAVYMLLRKGAPAHKVATIVTLKTITGMLFFLLALPLLLAHLLSNPAGKVRLLWGLSFLLLLAGGLFFLWRGALRRRSPLKPFLLKYTAHLRFFYRRKKLSFLLASACAVLLYVSFLLIGVSLLYAFNKSVPPEEVLKKQIALLYAIFVSPTPGGSGVGELGGLLVFSEFLSPYELGVFVILWRFISQYLSALVGGIIFFVCIVLDIKRYS
ncbi:MAG: flippase-like domain-containing protein [Aquificae bacterium]|nr:flippase-like domain-containing protein [Aquificota bacterium]